ncbi:hypothetical protein [Gordonia sp. (in: high G+C Gram-positive bacteria)]|uniref:hypothetical protein n=1 Tax=Gordonia sp. (in: high G+C Gram-positive bacteria) TaxID=84139 RepID=UPI0039E2880E
MADEGVKRTVAVGSMAYIDPTGRTRRADSGVEVLVHPDDVKRFDEFNVLMAAQESAQVDLNVAVVDAREVLAEMNAELDKPKRRQGRPRKSED